MKSLIIIASILLASVLAQASCLGEAQIIATVGGKKSDAMTFCRVMVSSVSFYAENVTCPLDVSEVMAKGIEIGLKNGHDCELESNTISGVIVKNQAGIIYLKKK
ncbi:MAG: hypothetical protein V4654_06815 [Bdellovibrionota bacterium]